MSEKTEFAGWWLWVLGLVIISIIALAALNAAGILTRTVVERKVFEQSYQKQEGDRERLATFRAQLAEIETRLSGQIDETTRSNLEAQRSALNIQIATIRSKTQ